MRRATRVFVRRQANWFKESDPDIKWFYAGEEDVTQMIESFINGRAPQRVDRNTN